MLRSMPGLMHSTQAIADLAEGWSVPEAWSGLTSMIGSDPMPGEMIGGMVLGELVVHGWDLARAVGVSVRAPVECWPARWLG